MWSNNVWFNPTFRVGDRVVTAQGDAGTVTESFYWKTSTDGTSSPPSHGDLPIEWDNGTRGYYNQASLYHEYM